MLCKIWGILKKIVCTAGMEEKILARAQSMVEKSFQPPRNHDTPGEKIMVRPLTYFSIFVVLYLGIAENIDQSIKTNFSLTGSLK